MEHRPDMLKRAEPRICAFDIETTKLPLQFPNAEYDQVIQSTSHARQGSVEAETRCGGVITKMLLCCAGVHDLIHAGQAGVPHSQPGGGGRGHSVVRVHPQAGIRRWAIMASGYP
jgi:hypothetical protein